MVDFNRFNEGRIFVPEAHLGNPVRMPGVTANPFDGLDRASGCDSADSDIARIGNLAKEVQQGVMAMTLLTPGPVLDSDVYRIFDCVKRELEPRLGEKLFYVCADTGEDIYQSALAYTRSQGAYALQGIGGCHVDALLERRMLALDAANQHDDLALQLIDSPHGGIILETGAGADFDRIKKMQLYAATRKSKLVCHDPTPLASKKSTDYLDDVSYIALPGSSEFLSLPFADLNKPFTVTLKDVVSSMGFGQMNELCNVGLNARARKILVTQSLGMAVHSNMIPETWRFGTPAFDSFVAMQTVYFLQKYMHNRELLQSCGFAVGLQVRHVISLVMMELAKRHMFERASQIAGLTNGRVVNVEFDSVLEGNGSIEYLEKFYPEFLPEFLNGKFNKLTVGPFGVILAKDGSIQNGRLKVSNIRNHWEFVKGKFADLDVGKKDQHVSVNPVDTVTVPKKFLAINRDYVLGSMKVFGFDEKGLSGLSPDQFRELNRVGAEIALKMMFDVWTREGGHPYIRPFLGKVEREIREAFVKGI